MLTIAGGIVIGFFAIAITIALLPLILRGVAIILGVGLLLVGVGLIYIIVMGLPDIIGELVEFGDFVGEEFGRSIVVMAFGGLLAALALPNLFSITQTYSYFAGVGFMTFASIALDLKNPSFSHYLLGEGHFYGGGIALFFGGVIALFPVMIFDCVKGKLAERNGQ